MSKFFGFLAIVLIGGFAYFSFRPMGVIHLENTEKIIGKVTKITQKSDDIFINLKNRDEVYFIKDGLKKGIFMQRIKKLEGKIVTIYYVKNDLDHFDPLDPFDTKKYIAKMKSISEVVYNEIVE